MKGNPQEIIGLRRAARLVRTFFANTPLRLHCIGPQYSLKHISELIASHHYLLLKSAEVLRMLTPFSFSRKSTASKKKLESSSAPLPLKGKDPMSDRIDGTPYRKGGLSRSRVHGWQFKECGLAKKQLQSLREAHAHTKPHYIFPLSENDIQEALSQTQEWQDQLSYKEERQFQITRITKILSS